MPQSSKSAQSQLIENNILLQKKTTELITSVNELSKKIDKMLSLFEAAAKSIEQGEVEEPLAKKIEALLDQNKTIARGLILVERYVRDKTSTGFQPSFPPKTLPRNEV